MAQPLYPNERSGIHCAGGWSSLSEGPVSIVQEAGRASAKVWYPLCRRLVEPQRRSGIHCAGGWSSPSEGLDRAENLAPLWFDPRTVQPTCCVVDTR